MKSLLITSTATLVLPVRNQRVGVMHLCAAGAAATLELFDGTIGTAATVAVAVGGTGYAVNDVLTLAQAGGSGGVQATVTVATVDGLVGEILTAAINAAGTGYTVNDVLTVEQVGGGVQATITVNTVGGGGDVTAITVTTGGSGYIVDTGLAVTGGTGTGFTLDVSSVAVGEIATVTLTSGGTGYVAGSTYATTNSGSGDDAATITVSTITDAGVSIGKLACAANTSAAPVELCDMTFNGVSARISGTAAQGYLTYE